jgi:hypothetical protein
MWAHTRTQTQGRSRTRVFLAHVQTAGSHPHVPITTASSAATPPAPCDGNNLEMPKSPRTPTSSPVSCQQAGTAKRVPECPHQQETKGSPHVLPPRSAHGPATYLAQPDQNVFWLDVAVQETLGPKRAITALMAEPHGLKNVHAQLQHAETSSTRCSNAGGPTVPQVGAQCHTLAYLHSIPLHHTEIAFSWVLLLHDVACMEGVGGSGGQGRGWCVL